MPSEPPEYHPQLAVLAESPPTSERYLHEMKWDGYRMGCRVVDGRVQLVSRNGVRWTAQLPEIVRAVEALACRNALLDGELVVLLETGLSSFEALQAALRARPPRPNLFYFVFDLLHLNDASLVVKTLEERKERLRALLKASARPRTSST